MRPISWHDVRIKCPSVIAKSLILLCDYSIDETVSYQAGARRAPLEGVNPGTRPLAIVRRRQPQLRRTLTQKFDPKTKWDFPSDTGVMPKQTKIRPKPLCCKAFRVISNGGRLSVDETDKPA